MDDFLQELRELLIKHHACIVRSASDNHELVACILTKENQMAKTQEATFDEEINDNSILYKWYQVERDYYV